MKKVLLLLLAMLVLTYVGQGLSSYLYKFESISFLKSLTLVGDNFVFVIFSNFALYCLEMARLSLIGRALSMRISFKDCFGAISLNILFAWITPAAILGAPAMAYYLYKRGHNLAGSITVAFVRSFSIIFVSAVTTIAIYSFDLQGPVENKALQEKIFFVLTGFAIYIAGLVFISYLPEKYLNKVKYLTAITSQIRAFFSNGKIIILPVLFLGLIINFTLVSFIPFVERNYYADYGPLISQTFLFLSYMLLMPTPGASGLAEVGAPMFFSTHIPVSEIIAAVTAMRISTIGVQVLVGLVFMSYFYKRNFSLQELMNFKKTKMKTSSGD
ncbi:MAG: YbhN family protein [Bacteriovoracia bacterium]